MKGAETGLVLGIDTCGVSSTLALGRGELGGVVTAQKALLPRTAGTHLTVALRELFGEAGSAAGLETGPSRLRAIVVVNGPGSFTGMRIGLSAAKALSEATGAPLVAVSRLAVLAASCGAPLVALDAGRGRVYLRLGEGDERLATVEEARAILGADTPSDLAVCEARVALLFPEAKVAGETTADDALRYGWARVEAGDWDDPENLDARYLWRPEEMLAPLVPAR